jgi:small-conductance mechanosensitive channel
MPADRGLIMPTHDSSRHPFRPAAALLGLLILLGSLLLVAIPFGWLWLLSRLGQPYIAVYFLALGGCPVMMIAWGMALVRLNQAYLRMSEPDDGGQLLEMSIAVSVVIGILILVAWLVLFSHGGGPVEGPWPG